MGWQERLKQRAEAIKVDTYALYLAYRDPRVPWYAKAWAALVVAYALSPIDLIPDFIPVLGYVDDLVLIPLGVSLALRLIPPEVMAECRQRAKVQLNQSPAHSWLGALIVVVIWLVVIALIAFLIIKAGSV
jgi:uncharacterized membrane protein YkvA (DUF1232 family)